MDPVLKQSLADFGQVMKWFTFFLLSNTQSFVAFRKQLAPLLSSILGIRTHEPFDREPSSLRSRPLLSLIKWFTLIACSSQDHFM